jgi:predicted hydrocarbon binding protein
MNRKEFVTLALAAGACGCGGALLAQTSPPPSPEVQELQRKVQFMRTRMARLVRALDAPTRQKVLETMGRECAKEFAPMIEPYRGRPEAFLEDGRQRWMQSTDYDKTRGTIRIVDRAKTCSCPFVEPGLTPADFCACTLGWQKEAYATILEQPVDAEIESSILRGAGQCAFRIHPAGAGGAH